MFMRWRERLQSSTQVSSGEKSNSPCMHSYFSASLAINRRADNCLLVLVDGAWGKAASQRQLQLGCFLHSFFVFPLCPVLQDPTDPEINLCCVQLLRFQKWYVVAASINYLGQQCRRKSNEKESETDNEMSDRGSSSKKENDIISWW